MIQAHSAALWILSGVSAGVSRFGPVSRSSGRLRVATGTLALAALAALGWLSGQGWLLALALSFSAAGELLIGLRARGGLTPGLLALMLARAAFIVVFARTGGGVLMFRAEPIRLAGGFAAVAGSILTLRLVWSRLGPAAGPVSVFAVATAALAVLAFTLPWVRWPAMVGAQAMLASDALAAVNVFNPQSERRWTPDWLIWWLSYAGHALIAVTFVDIISR